MTNPMTIEQIEKAAQTSELLCQDLRGALKTARAVESIVIMQAIEDAAKLRSTLDNLLLAVREDAK